MKISGIMLFLKFKLVLTLVVLLFSCNSQKRYLDKTLDIMEAHAIYTNQVDWAKIREDSNKQLMYANTIKDVHGILRETFRYLKDGGHSFLMSSNRYEHIKTSEEALPVIESEVLAREVGYLKVPGFIGTPKMAQDFAKELQKRIKLLDLSNLTGWIIDLSGNTGGNMWPMLLGLSPIIGDGIYGYFKDTNENYMPWGYENGQLYIGKNTMMKIEDPYKIKNGDKKIALIMGEITASSGEATLISFIGKNNTRLFGSGTAGLTTGNQSFELKDGARLYLTTTIFVDRNMKPYGKKIKPDYATFQPLKHAMEWIGN